MTYVGKKPADIIATAVDTTTGTFSGDLTVDTSTLYVDSANNRVGIGTSSPASPVHISSNADTVVTVQTTNATADGRINFRNSGGTDSGRIWYNTSGNRMMFYTDSTEAMRIDNSGNLLVGKTSTDITVEGVVIKPTDTGGGMLFATSSGERVAILNRNTDDGSILEFRKANSVVGSIGNNSTELFIGTPSGSGGYIRLQSGGIVPATSTGANSDGTMQIGTASGRFSDLYLSGGVYLGGTGSANKLDDYEEGTWTPTHGGNNMIQNGGNASYVKVGRLVTVTADVTSASGSSSTNQIGGLPFAAVNPHGSAYVSFTSASNSPAGAYIDGTILNFIQNGGQTGSNINANERIIFVGVYYTN